MAAALRFSFEVGSEKRGFARARASRCQIRMELLRKSAALRSWQLRKSPAPGEWKSSRTATA
ncbi:MAG: hypothetical protein D6691_03365 [Candidatus Hydrogenedentota bacterium]|nr:MAG: hypothetical protein D6691_03365 [Candidatus Hydrogenedentota bacterium]